MDSQLGRKQQISPKKRDKTEMDHSTISENQQEKKQWILMSKTLDRVL